MIYYTINGRQASLEDYARIAASRVIPDLQGRLALAEAKLAAVEAVVAPWPPGVRKGDVLRALDGGQR